jgi:hypothetical protein
MFKPSQKRMPATANNGQTRIDSTQSTSSQQGNQVDCSLEFLEAMRQAGVVCIDSIIADGQIHRFAPGGKGNTDGWYKH